MKTLIAYFSHRGMNYAPGGMVELKVGNTERAAKAAAGSGATSWSAAEPGWPPARS